MEKILIVDDEEVVRDLVGDIFEESSYTVIKARDGYEGLEALAEHADIAIVLTDIRMPRMDGVEFIRLCREKYGPIPIIVVTGVYEGMEIPEAYYVMPKPCDFRHLVKIVKSALSA